MTKEGRLLTHENCLRLGKPSPYAEEFGNHDEDIKENKIQDETILDTKKTKKEYKK